MRQALFREVPAYELFHARRTCVAVSGSNVFAPFDQILSLHTGEAFNSFGLFIDKKVLV